MKKLALIMGIMLTLCGCGLFSGETASPAPTAEQTEVSPSTPTPVPTLAPTPTPEPKVYVSVENEQFASELSERGLSNTTPDLSYEGRKIVVLQGEGLIQARLEYMLAAGAEVIVCGGESAVSEGVTLIPYEPSTTAQELIDACLSYPPHDTPVRLLGMFETEDSELKTLWNERVDEGKILVKGVYYATDEEQTAEEWLADMLDQYVEGMLDAILCETEEQAIAAASALVEAQRKDLLEVFALEFFGDYRSFEPYLAGWIDVDWATAADSAFAAVSALIEGGEAGELRAYSDFVRLPYAS
ncbi:MAG: hypothetical protein Q4C04_06670 [Clostridia bacterium]|nr:hypothetical protein [Clostridia bacterium]